MSSPGSFRDPDATLVTLDGRYFRLVSRGYADDFSRVLELPSVVAGMGDGSIVRTWPIPDRERPRLLGNIEGDVYEHEPVPFVSYPSEWSRTMVADAADLTIRLAESLLAEGFILKDATPANVLFRGSKPVFVDLPSIVPRPTGTFLWNARQQFETTFLMPVMLEAEAGVPLAWSLQNPVAGVTHETAAKCLGHRRWLKPRHISGVALPAMLSRRAEGASAASVGRRLVNDQQAAFVLQQNFRRLRRRLRQETGRARGEGSAWREYTSTRCHYEVADLDRKGAFVKSALESTSPTWVLDVGANTGEFSALSAGSASVVALEADAVAADLIHRRAKETGLPIHTVVANFARPTPGTGWRNGETRSLLVRLAQQFDLVLMLAVIHHLRVSEGVPLAEIVSVAAEITRDALVIEHVPPTDPMFRLIARGREALYRDCDRDAFEQLLLRHFTIQSCELLENGRTIYLARSNKSKATIENR